MTRVPAVERTLAILNLLAAQPQRALRAKDIGDALSISPATTLSLLQTLTEAGFLARREPGKTYALGPRLIAIGSVAASQDGGFESARAEVRSLSERFGVEALAAAAVGGRIEVIARTTPRAWRPVGIDPGSALAPPDGLVYMSWAPAEEFDGWLAASPRDLGADGAAAYRAAAAVVRARGYAGGLDNHPDEIAQIMTALDDSGDERDRLRRAMDLMAILRHGMSFITAPVFDAQGAVPLALTLFPPDDVTTREHQLLVDGLLEACARLTTALGGTPRARGA